MGSKFRALFLMMLLALSTVTAFAQDAAAEPSTPQGLGLGMIIFGLLAVFAVGYLMAQRESSADEDDLV